MRMLDQKRKSKKELELPHILSVDVSALSVTRVELVAHSMLMLAMAADERVRIPRV